MLGASLLGVGTTFAQVVELNQRMTGDQFAPRVATNDSGILPTQRPIIVSSARNYGGADNSERGILVISLGGNRAFVHGFEDRD